MEKAKQVEIAKNEIRFRRQPDVQFLESAEFLEKRSRGVALTLDFLVGIGTDADFHRAVVVISLGDLHQRMDHLGLCPQPQETDSRCLENGQASQVSPGFVHLAETETLSFLEGQLPENHAG